MLLLYSCAAGIYIGLFQVSVTIIEDYIILGGADFLQMHASSVARILDLIVGNVNDKGILSTLPVIDTLVQVLRSHICEYIFGVVGTRTNKPLI